MGCSQSKIENEESVFRCKQRKLFMKQSVTARNAFAAAHSSYITLLKNTGAALNDYGQGETTEVRAPGLLPTPPPIDPLPAPPPLPPLFPSPTRTQYLQAPIGRSVSLPPIALQKEVDAVAKMKMNSSPPRKSTITEDEDAEEEAERDDRPAEAVVAPPPPPPRASNPPPPPPPAQNSPWDFFDVGGFTYQKHDEAPAEEMQQTEIMQSREEEEVAAADDHILMEEDDEKDDDTDAHDSPIKTPEKVVQHSNSNKVAEPVALKEELPLPLAIPSDHGKGRGKGGKDLLQVLQDIDDQFLKASEGGQEVSKMLEANRLHYHSNFADNKGMIDPERVKRVITWNRSFKFTPSDDVKEEEKETHASVLDKLLAWEKKLYDEVKAGELMKIEYQKKIALLNRQKKRGRNSEALEKTKAAVKYLHTRYMVDFQAMDSTSSEIRRLRDEQLYPNLVELVAGMAKMWKSMYDSHRRQQEIVSGLRSIDISNAPEETTEQHHQRTVQLHNVVIDWQSQSGKLVHFQKEYINALNNWLRLNLIPIESNLKEKVSSPPKTVLPPIHALLQEWHNELDKVPDTVVLEAIKSFAAIIERIVEQQQDEIKQKSKYEEIKNEHERKRRAFEEWERRNRDKSQSELNESESTGANSKDPIKERKAQLGILKEREEEEKEKHKKACKYTRALSLNSLKTGLPAVFEAM
ncbi:hypothetical protein KI387_025331, partial [Taxus chinensis]